MMKSNQQTTEQQAKRQEIYLKCLAKGREEFLKSKAEKKESVLQDESVGQYAEELAKSRVLGTIKHFDIKLLEDSIPISEHGFQQRTLFTKGQSMIEKQIEEVSIRFSHTHTHL